MSDAEKLQNILRDIQATRQQLMTTTSQIREFEVTLDALSNQEEEKKVYRQIGALLFEVDDRESMEEQLITSIKTLKEHLKLLEKQDNELKKIYESTVSEIEKTD
ncbi:MAG TPA: prefoldin subunit [Candidatus Poseidoniaceae archaeon]|jgi:chaperonin cofactor prefoldin|nr:prefoldin subunit [Candidatus Poseidoniaceae archaeon]